jgi:ATP-dependent RNA helicase DDX46/PRP5
MCTAWAALAEQVAPSPCTSLLLLISSFSGKDGTAYTFVTPEQDHFSPDLVKALEKSNRHVCPPPAAKRATTCCFCAGFVLTRDTQVPQDLREMLAEFRKKIKEGGAKQHKGSGFGGRGFKFDTSEQVKHER